MDPAALRAKIVLAGTAGEPIHETAARLNTTCDVVQHWQKQFGEHRMPAMRMPELKRAGRKPVRRNENESKILSATLHVAPPDGKRWTCRGLASHLGLSSSLVQRVWRSAGILSDWRQAHFSDPPFRAGDRAVVLGGYFCGAQRIVIAEVTSGNEEDEPGRFIEPVVLISTNASTENEGLQIIRRQKMQIDQLIGFLTDVQKQALVNSRLRIITENPSDLSHVRLRRWLRRSGRFSIHSSSSIRGYLSIAESKLRSIVAKSFYRVADANLRLLYESRKTRSDASMDAATEVVDTATAN